MNRNNQGTVTKDFWLQFTKVKRCADWKKSHD